MGKAQKPYILRGCRPKEIKTKSLALVSEHKRFSFDHMSNPEGGSWLKKLVIAAFDQGASPSCWAATVCRAIQAYLSIYGTTLPASTMGFSPQCLIDCVACVVGEKVLENWYPEDKCYSYGTFQTLCFAAKYGISSLKSYEYRGKMMSCKNYDPIVAPISIVSLKMYEKSYSEIGSNENGVVPPMTKGEVNEEKLKTGFDQIITEDMEVASDEQIIEHLQRSPMLGTFQCFKDYEKYKGEGVYYGPRQHPIKCPSHQEPSYHAVIVTGYKKATVFGRENTLVLQVHTSNKDFGNVCVGFIPRYLFIAMESIRSVSPTIETSDDIFGEQILEEETMTISGNKKKRKRSKNF